MSGFTLDLLGVRVILNAPQELLGGVRSFVDAYDTTSPSCLPVTREIVVDVERARITEPDAHSSITRVHHSKHEYWNFDARVSGAGPPLVAWWFDRGLHIELPEAMSPIRVRVRPEVSEAIAGESIFHLVRSIALYLRASGNLLHASAVVYDEAAVLFVGSVCSGKTTLMTEAVLSCGARPLANDRVFVPAIAPQRAVSWPSYSSFCEGTLISYPPLASAALRYERDSCAYRTRRWSAPLALDFSPQRKRAYPMVWFTEAAAKRYVRDAPLSALVLVRLDPAVASVSWSRLDASEDTASSLSAELVSNSFDAHEPSFLPWHGLRSPMNAPPLDDLVHQSQVRGLRFYRLTAPPTPLPWLQDFLNEVTDAR